MFSRRTQWRHSGTAALAGAAAVLAAALLAGVTAGAASARPLGSQGPTWTWPGAAMLTVVTAPLGGGWVRSVPYQIDCPKACQRPFSPGTVVQLRAHPTAGFTFAGWTGDACVGQGPTCRFTITGPNPLVFANFRGHYSAPAPSSDSDSDADSSSGSDEPTLVLTTGAGSYSSAEADVSFGSTSSGCGYFSSCHFQIPAGTAVTIDSTGYGSGTISWTGPCAGQGDTCTFTMPGSDVSVHQTLTPAAG